MVRFFVLIFPMIVVLSPVPYAHAGNVEKNDVFESKSAGFRVTKPESWRVASAAEHFRSLGRVKLADDELHKLVLKFSTTPLVVFMRHEEPHHDLNPSFKVIIKPLGKLDGSNPMKIADLIILPLRNILSNLTLHTREEVFMGGRKAAYARMEFDLESQADLSFRVLSEMWIVPRDRHFFMIGAARKFGDADAGKEIRETIESISFF